MQRLALNKNNFLRIYSTGQIALPVTPMREKDLYSPPLIFVPGETYALYLNSTIGISDFTFYTPDSSHAVATSISNVTIPAVGTHKFIEFTFPAMPDGIYKINLGGAYRSNGMEVINDVEIANELSVYAEYNHNKIIGDFYYPYMADPTKKQRARIRMWAKDHQPEVNIEGYEATNTGRFRNLQGISRNYVLFETPDYSLEDHQAASLFSLHDNIVLNGRTYIRRPAGSYRQLPDNTTPLSNGEFSLYDNDSTVLLKC